MHRDVKPGNLLVEKAGDDAEPDHVYLTDFGITKRAAEHTWLTATGQSIGTVDYLAPEQVRGLPVLGTADQYSLGCMQYECLTGRVPFERHMNAAIISAHVEEQPTRPTMLRPDLPRAADEVFAIPVACTGAAASSWKRRARRLSPRSQGLSSTPPGRPLASSRAIGLIQARSPMSGPARSHWAGRAPRRPRAGRPVPSGGAPAVALPAERPGGSCSARWVHWPWRPES